MVRDRVQMLSRLQISKILYAILGALSVLGGSITTTGVAADERPNILWITAEDMSPTLGCYGDRYATTPNIDRLAADSVRYTHAFATAPVCSPSRSCLITGCYATSLGTLQMRSAFPIPDEMKGFAAYLRAAGFYTTNNVKTDYNTANWQKIVAASWDESSPQAHWRNRKDAEPFFSIFNLMTSHQSRSMQWPYEKFVDEVQSRLAPNEIHDPAAAPLPPYYPDTPVVRRTVARYYDCVTAMDKEVGAILGQLDKDGLTGDTIVFFYSDHGSGMPRHKRCLLDSGMHVPLLVRFPNKWKHLAPAAAGETTDRLVSFVDFAPTVLSLAGVAIPDYMQGQPFLGAKQTEPRRYVFGHRDRVDEVIDTARSVRNQRYLYVRNYRPQLGWNQPTAWPDAGEVRHEFYRMADRQRMTDAQWHFAGPTRAAVELYDCEKDPLNLNNLAESPEHVEALHELTKAARRHRAATMDVGLIPEIEAWRFANGATLWEAARNGKVDLERVSRSAELSSHGSEKDLLRMLSAGDASVRYWAAVGLDARGVLSAAAKQMLTASLADSSASVKIAAASALANHGDVEGGLAALVELLEADDLTTVLYAARAIELLGDKAKAAVPAMRAALARAEKIRPPDTPATVVTSGDQDLAMFIGFSARAFLSRVAAQEETAAEANQKERGEWIQLFDGKTLNGWSARADGQVTVEDGEIHLLAKGKNLWLVHEGEFGDFELQVEAKMPSDNYNSGIGFRCQGKSGKPKGYQCEIDRQKSGMIYAIGSGWVWPNGAEETKRFRAMASDCFDNDDWNSFRIRCQGERIEIWINGVKTADVTDKRFPSGSVALQHHGKGGVHRFRNVRLRRLYEDSATD